MLLENQYKYNKGKIMKNTQIKAVDVQTLIDDVNLNLTLSKEGKKWVLDGRKFDNLKQVVSYINGLSAIAQSGSVVDKTAKQGEDGIQMNPDSIVVLQQTFKAPIPSQTKDKKATEDYQSDGGFGTVVKNQLAIVPKVKKADGSKVLRNGDQVYTLPEELNEVQAIKTKYNSVLNKYCLQYEIQGNRVVSVHHIDKVKEAINEANDALQKVLAEIIAKLPDWKEESKKLGHYIDGKFPSVNYFKDSYKVCADFLRLGDSFAFEDDIKRNAFGNIKSDLESFLESVTAYLSDDAKKFRDSHFANMSDSLAVIKESGVVSGEKVEKLIEIAEKAISEVNPSAIREAKQKLDKGGVVATAKRGRKPSEVSQDDLEECNKYLDTALDPLKELAEELEGIC